MSYPRTPTTTTSAATTTPNATPNEPYDASPATPTVSATPSVSIPSKPHSSPTAASVTAIFDAAGRPGLPSWRRRSGGRRRTGGSWGLPGVPQRRQGRRADPSANVSARLGFHAGFSGLLTELRDVGPGEGFGLRLRLRLGRQLRRFR